MRYIIICTFLFMLSSAQADPIVLTGGGTISCGKWISVVDAKDEIQMQISIQWVAGYTGAYNWYRAQDDKQTITQPDLETISLWLTTYCRNNPTDLIVNAAAALVQHLGGRSTRFRWVK